MRHLDEKVKRKAELEQKKAELEKFQAMKDLDIAEAQVKAITDLELKSDTQVAQFRGVILQYLIVTMTMFSNMLNHFQFQWPKNGSTSSSRFGLS